MEITAIDILLISIFVGTCLGLMIWAAVNVFMGLEILIEFIANVCENVIGRPVVRYAKFLKENWSFIRWKKEKLPDLQERTRHNDREALAERIVKSEHVRE